MNKQHNRGVIIYQHIKKLFKYKLSSFSVLILDRVSRPTALTPQPSDGLWQKRTKPFSTTHHRSAYRIALLHISVPIEQQRNGNGTQYLDDMMIAADRTSIQAKKPISLLYPLTPLPPIQGSSMRHPFIKKKECDHPTIYRNGLAWSYIPNLANGEGNCTAFCPQPTSIYSIPRTTTSITHHSEYCVSLSSFSAHSKFVRSQPASMWSRSLIKVKWFIGGFRST